MTGTSLAFVLVTGELDETNAVYGAVRNFIDIYEDDVDRVTIIGPESVRIDHEIVDSIPIPRSATDSMFSTSIEYLYYQLKISREILKERERFDFVFFHIGGSMLLFPMIVSQISGNRSLVFITGSTSESFYAQYGRSWQSTILANVIKSVETLTYAAADDVILLSESMGPHLIHRRFPTDVRVANLNYIDCSYFSKDKYIRDRTDDIVFVGRLESVKGVEKIVQALPELINQYPDLKVKFIGSGEKKDGLEDFVHKNNLENHVTFTGWIDQEEIPKHLTNARTLLMPSVSEGVPKTILEAMSCGTIPIATPVGGIPDIIDKRKNGFLLQDSSPKTIKKTVSAILSREDLESISENARQYVKENHSYNHIHNLYVDMISE